MADRHTACFKIDTRILMLRLRVVHSCESIFFLTLLIPCILIELIFLFKTSTLILAEKNIIIKYCFRKLLYFSNF